MSKQTRSVSTSGWPSGLTGATDSSAQAAKPAHPDFNERNHCIESSTRALGFLGGMQSNVLAHDLKGNPGRRVVMVRLDENSVAIVKMVKKPSGEHRSQSSPIGLRNGIALNNDAAFKAASEPTPVDLHDFIQAGIPRSELVNTLLTFPYISKDDMLANVLGVSPRKVQRMQIDGDKNMSTEQAGRLISFMKIMSLAIDVLGGKEQAQNWLQRKAIGLDQRRPIEFMTTDVVSQAVHILLEQIDAGVYV
jgi:putative toxin-antitoxin system antitoxin component (TIGR02293 family)